VEYSIAFSHRRVSCRVNLAKCSIVLLAIAMPLASESSTVDDSFLELNKRLEKAQSAPACPLALATQLKGSGDSLKIAFSLTNIGSSSIVADDWQLPWGNANSLQFVVFNSKAVIVPLAIAIDDPFAGKHANVAPGAAVHGEYSLCLTSICSEAKKSSLTVLWSYRVPSTSTPGPVCTGIIFIPRQG